MAGKVVGKFEGYSLREIQATDYEQLDRWIAADEAHAGLMDPEFFMGQAIDENGELAPDPRVSCYALEDRNQVLMYIRLSRAARVNIQFPPPAPADDKKAQHMRRKQVVNALFKGMAFLEVHLERAGVEEWIFNTVSDALKMAVEKRLGFRDSPNEMLRVIPRLDHREAKEEV